MRVTIGLLVCLVFGCLFACGSELATSETVAEPEPSPVVVSLRFQHLILRVEADERFTLVDTGGSTLAEHITLEELWSVAPEIAQDYEQAVASPIDASLDADLLAPPD